jgi:hypothetical protein
MVVEEDKMLGDGAEVFEDGSGVRLKGWRVETCNGKGILKADEIEEYVLCGVVSRLFPSCECLKYKARIPSTCDQLRVFTMRSFALRRVMECTNRALRCVKLFS